MTVLTPPAPFGLPDDPDELAARGEGLGISVTALVRAYGPFLARVDLTTDRDGCWRWTGNRGGNAYGLLNVQGRRAPVGAHRLAYSLGVGAIPQKLMVLHHCDRPDCCRPAHLFTGTALDNAQDAARKGRLRGGRRILSDETVRAIRVTVTESMAAGLPRLVAQEALAEVYGVSVGHIHSIVDGRARAAA